MKKIVFLLFFLTVKAPYEITKITCYYTSNTNYPKHPGYIISAYSREEIKERFFLKLLNESASKKLNVMFCCLEGKYLIHSSSPFFQMLRNQISELLSMSSLSAIITDKFPYDDLPYFAALSKNEIEKLLQCIKAQYSNITLELDDELKLIFSAP